MRSRIIWLTVTLLGTACQTRMAEQVRDAKQPLNEAHLDVAETGAPTVSALERADAPPQAADGGGFSLPGATDVLPNLVIRSGTATLQVDSLERGVVLVRELARRVGGFVGGSSTQAGRGQLHSATLEIRMPAERFDEAVDGLRPLGSVEAVNVSAQDVGEEYVDVQARMFNDHRLEARLIDLLAQRTGKLGDVLDVEHELARVREEIERYEGRLRYLKSRAAVSTLSITIHEPIPVVDQGSPGVVGEAVRQAWRNFIALIASVIQSLGVIIPLGVVALLAWLGMKRWRRQPPRPAEA